MPYRSGTWGLEAKERSKRRLDYFHARNQRRYELNKDEEKAKVAKYYEQHREEILKKMAFAYSTTDVQTRCKLRYQQKKDKLKAYSRNYYKLHRAEILEKKRADTNSKK